jgi:hypothetical protein
MNLSDKFVWRMIVVYGSPYEEAKVEFVEELLSHPVFKAKNQMLIVCMSRIKLSYKRSECKHRIPMSLLYRILLQKFITSRERTK